MGTNEQDRKSNVESEEPEVNRLLSHQILFVFKRVEKKPFLAAAISTTSTAHL
jgi:hypothetical protein